MTISLACPRLRAHAGAEVEERAETEQRLRDKLSLIDQQEAIRALATPIIEVWEGVLTLPLIGIVDSQRAADMMTRLLEAITRKRARYTVLDLTGPPGEGDRGGEGPQPERLSRSPRSSRRPRARYARRLG